MDSTKYNFLKKIILKVLNNANGPVTHTEMIQLLNLEITNSGIPFEGAVEWHMEWVKLDLEARKEIKRIANKGVIQFIIA